jgi:hypothetical protein
VVGAGAGVVGQFSLRHREQTPGIPTLPGFKGCRARRRLPQLEQIYSSEISGRGMYFGLALNEKNILECCRLLASTGWKEI